MGWACSLFVLVIVTMGSTSSVSASSSSSSSSSSELGIPCMDPQGQLLVHGTQWWENEYCTFKICDDGDLQTFTVLCDEARCPQPKKVQGYCCEVCPIDYIG